MKRVLLTVALCVAASVSFAQKKAVNEAQSIAKGTTPDFSEARTLIKGALENPETKDKGKTFHSDTELSGRYFYCTGSMVPEVC